MKFLVKCLHTVRLLGNLLQPGVKLVDILRIAAVGRRHAVGDHVLIDVEHRRPAQIRLLADGLVTVFDVETTGLSAERDRLIEIAAVKIKNGAEIDSFESYINPERPISELITRLTSITDDDVRDAPVEKEVMTDF